MSELAENLKGKFIVIDGPDGAGKSTQLRMLKDYLTGEGLAVETVIDPGGTHTGQRIREILLGRESESVNPVCETFLFMASRAQLVHEKIRPAVQAGKIVLCDRFISATLAYQGSLGIDKDFVLDLGKKAIGETWPDLTIILDLPVEDGMRRIGAVRGRLKSTAQNGSSAGQLALFGDRLESRSSDYHERVRQNFKQIDKYYPAPVCHLDGAGNPQEVFEKLRALLGKQFCQ